MVYSKVAKKVIPKVAKYAQGKTTGKKAAVAGAVVAASEVAEDNPYLSAAEGAMLGAAVAGPVGAVAGGLVGWFMADGERIAPCDLVAIPAYEMALLRQGMAPSFQIYIKEGELIAPILPTDAMQNTAALEGLNEIAVEAKKPRRKGSGLPKKYAKMGFKKGWREYKKTPAWKKKQAAKKKKGGRKR